MFDGDLARDRQLLEGILDGIYVYADGAIVLRFKDQSLFEPVQSYNITKLDTGLPALPAAREELAVAKSVVATDRAAGASEDWAYGVAETETGIPYVTVTKGGQHPQDSARKNVGVPSGIRNVSEPVGA